MNNQTPISLDNEEFKEVEQFTYLGSRVAIDGNCVPEIRNRKSKAAGVFSKLNDFWKNKNIKQNTKLNIYRSNVLSVLLYRAETCTMTRESERRLSLFHTKCLRRLLNIRWNDFNTNIEVREKANTKDVITTIKRKSWSYLGHVLSMAPTRIPRQAWEWTPFGKIKRRRPRITLRGTIKKDMTDGNITDVNLNEKAQDRSGWQALLSALCADSTGG